jgi:hypothetical protein
LERTEQKTIDQTRARVLGDIDSQVTLSQGVNENWFSDLLADEVLKLVEDAEESNWDLFESDMTTVKEVADKHIWAKFIFSAVTAVLGSLPGIPESKDMSDATKKLVKAYRYVNDGTKIVGASFGTAVGAQYIHSSNRDTEDTEGQKIAVSNFKNRKLKYFQSARGNAKNALHLWVQRMWRVYNLPAQLRQGASGVQAQVSFLKRLVNTMFDTVKPQSLAYRELLAEFFTENGIGLVIMKPKVTGNWAWSIAGLPESVNTLFMPKLLEYTEGCLQPSINFKTADGFAVQSAIKVAKTVSGVRPQNTERTHLYRGNRDVPVTADDEKHWNTKKFCLAGGTPNFQLPPSPAQRRKVGNFTVVSHGTKSSTASGVGILAGLWFGVMFICQ